MQDLAKTRMIYDYSEILRMYGVSYSPVDYCWQVGESPQTQGWIIHLSVIRAQLQELLEAIIPELLAQNLPFQVVRDINLAFNLLEGGLGYRNLGKMITVYPPDEATASETAKWLITRTAGFRGPHIPTDRHLGGIVYTRYGSINPVIRRDGNGEWVKYIHNAQGQLIRDPYHIPFALPQGISWPFGELAPPEEKKQGKLLNYKYFPLHVLKPDVKGDVIRALYFKRPWQIKSCLIKQGRPNMFADAMGRDIRDRLQWQYELYQALHDEIPMPEVFDYFEWDGNMWLAMQFIKGHSLLDWIGKIYKARSWGLLSTAQRLQLLDCLLEILDIIGRLHRKGFVHRDIQPANFLLDKKGRIYLIDMELTWSANIQPPKPPFLLGTPGHMSPEQMAGQMPTIKEDIYGVGSLVFVFLTNYYALKLVGQREGSLYRSLRFFVDDPIVAHCIASCWGEVPEERPSLEHIVSAIMTYREKITTKKSGGASPTNPAPPPAPSRIREIILGAITNLGSPELISPEYLWISQSIQRETHIGNAQVGMEIQEGWHTGIAGPMWLLALAKKAGFSVEACQTPYDQGWEYVKAKFFERQEGIHPGLYAGSAGIALAIGEGLNSGMLPPERETLERLQKCFSIMPEKLDLSEGVAGQGLALMQVSPWLEGEFVKSTLSLYAARLVETQQKDGAWNDYTGIDHGTAGIVLFLLSYIERYSDDKVKSAAKQAMEWLEEIGNRNGNVYAWPVKVSARAINHWGMGMGVQGVTLAFIRAYAVLQDPGYRCVAEQCLKHLAAYPMIFDLSLGSGLAGLGETYLEANRVFNDPYWLERAGWIANILVNSYKETKEGVGHWVLAASDITTAELFFGNGGVIHFLLGCLSPETQKHVLYL